MGVCFESKPRGEEHQTRRIYVVGLHPFEAETVQIPRGLRGSESQISVSTGPDGSECRPNH